MFPFFRGYDEDLLGQSLKTWSYSHPRWKKALGNLIPVLGAVGVALVSVPKVSEQVPVEAQVALFGAFAAAIVLSTRWRGDLTYEIFQRGLTIKQSEKWRREKTRTVLWKDLDNCSYDERGVKLMPKGGLGIPVSLYCDGNRMEAYSLCRERIDAFRFGDKEHKVPEAFGKVARTISEGRKSGPLGFKS